MRKTVKTADLMPILKAVIASSYVSSDSNPDVEHLCKKVFCAMMSLMELDDKEQDEAFEAGMKIALFAKSMVDAVHEKGEETLQ